MDKNNSVIDIINDIIVRHKENYEGKNTVKKAKTFNAELCKCLNCTYEVSGKSDFKYFNPITKKEIKKQKEALTELKEVYSKEDNLDKFADLLYEYVLKYVYSKRNYEDFMKSGCKHSIDHNLRVAYFVKNVLEKLKNISEEFKKDAIICSILHDVTHRGSPDFTDHESVIQSNLFIKTLSEIDPKYDQNMKYDQDILTDKDELDINKLEKEKEKEKEKIEKNKSSYILASLVSLGDCIDYARCGEIDNNIFTTRVNNVCKLTEIDQVVLNKVIQQSAILCQSMDGRNYPYDNRWLYKETTRIPQESLKTNFDLITKEIPDINKPSSESFKNYLLYHFLAKPLTNIRTEESFKQIYSGLRNENLYFLMKSCDWFEDNEKEICNIEKLNEANVAFTKVIKSKVDGKHYIIRKTVYDNNFVDLRKEKHFTEFRIYEYNEGLEGLLKKEANSVQEDKKEFSKELETKLSEHIINQNKIAELTNILDKVSKKVIEGEGSNQVKRAERLNPFIEVIFKNNPKLVSKIKKQIQKSIKTIFNDGKTITKKFKAKELLAENLKLIKTLYKGEKDYTDNYLMLNKICNSETEQELYDSINYTLYHSALRKYYKERTEYNPLLENVKTKNVFDCNIFRGISVTEDFDIQQAFDMLGVFNTKTFDFYHGKDSYIEKINYDSRKIDNCNSRGNITSFSISYNKSFKYTNSDGILFVIKPNKEKYKEIFGKVDLSINSDSEVNTPDIETTDIAFALKYKGGLIEDVVFNKNFDGEFYKNNKLISQEELKQYILSIRNDKSKIVNFLEKKLKIERVLKVEVETKEEGKETIDSTNSLPSDIQNLICSNVSDLLKLKQVNDIIKLYYECKNINKKLSEYNSQNKNTEIESIIENINVIIENIKQIENLNNFDLKNKKLEFEKQIIEFLSINEDVRNTVATVLVSTYIDRILNEYNSFEKNVQDNINKVTINFGTMQHLGKLYSIRHSINLSQETINNILRRVLNDEDSKNLTTFINCIKKENFLKSTNTIIETCDILTIINHKKCNDIILKAIIGKISVQELLETKITINEQECTNLLEAILNHEKCNDTVLQKIIDKIGPEGLLKENQITIINKEEKTIICNNALEAILNHDKCNNTVLQTIIDNTSAQELLETKITINEQECTNLLKVIVNHKKCDATVLRIIIDNTSAQELLETKITINGKEYNNLLEVFLSNKECNYFDLTTIIGKTSVQELLETRTITINEQEYTNLLGAIVNHEECDGYVLKSIIDKISAEELLEGRTTILLQTVLSNKECDYSVLQAIIKKFDLGELLEKITIRINGKEYNNLLGAIVNHEECDGYVLKSIIGKASAQELLKTKITINKQEYNNLLEVILSNKNCDYSVLEAIIKKFDLGELLEKITIRINEKEYNNLLGAILSNKNCDYSVLEAIIKKFDIKELIKNNILTRILNHDKCIGYTLRTIIEKFDPGELLEKRTTTINRKKYVILLRTILSNKECDEYVLQAIIEKLDIKELIENNILTHILNHDKCTDYILSTIIKKFDPGELLKENKITIINKEEAITYNNALEGILNNAHCGDIVLETIVNKIDDILECKECCPSTLSLILEKIELKEKEYERSIIILYEQKYKQLKEAEIKIKHKIDYLLNSSLPDCSAEFDCRISSSKKKENHNLNK